VPFEIERKYVLLPAIYVDTVLVLAASLLDIEVLVGRTSRRQAKNVGPVGDGHAVGFCPASYRSGCSAGYLSNVNNKFPPR